MKKKLPVALSGCAALVFTLTACGGEDDNKADEWAQNVCDQVQPQVARIQEANTAIAEASDGSHSPEEVQQADSDAFGNISEAYGALADAVDSAGDPPVDDGAQLREDAVTELRGISDSYGQLRETMDGLDTSDQGAFAEGLQEIAGHLEELGQSGDEALNELQSSELGEAMARQDGCQSPSAPSETDDGADAGDTGGGEGEEAPADEETEAGDEGEEAPAEEESGEGNG
ncbi:small secreted protein [Streptomyces sp. DSM 44915]|uniref:Small secreted protein n=1 Tax=Streptomyces chisholmiae TaxID=3075540 RepID=A0ABU2JPJ7_9ACTN|nr:small secreted protein [Streptomyces sp. DSM 44915]MDT0266909.1 small secreted protein [Streptomyces sp. DSM 44915]